MALPTGTISMSQVNTELKNTATATISLNDGQVRQLAGRPSGTISMSDLRGKSFTKSVNVVVFDGTVTDSKTITINYNVYSCILRVKNNGSGQLIVQVMDGSKIEVPWKGTGDVALLQGYGKKIFFNFPRVDSGGNITATLIGEVYV